MDDLNKKKVLILLAVCTAVVFSFAGCKPYSSYDLSKYIKVGKYKGLEVKSYTIKVTDKEVNKKIKSNLKAAVETKDVKTGKVKKGDTVTISYDGKVNGKSFDGGSAQDASLTIGSGEFINGFESGLIGVNVGSTKTLNLKFPSDYSTKKLAGKKVVYKVTVESVQKQITPTLNEDFVKKNSSQSTVAEYKKAIKQQLYDSKKETAVNNQKEYLWNKVYSDSKVKTDKSGNEKYPDREVKRVTKQLTEQYKDQAKQANLSFKKYLKQQMGLTEKQFNQQAKAYAKMEVKQEEIIYYIADKENIDVTKKQYKNYIKKSLKQYGFTEDSFKDTYKKSYEDYVGKDNIYKSIYLEKVEDMMLKNAKVVDKLSD